MIEDTECLRLGEAHWRPVAAAEWARLPTLARVRRGSLTTLRVWGLGSARAAQSTLIQIHHPDVDWTDNDQKPNRTFNSENSRILLTTKILRLFFAHLPPRLSIFRWILFCLGIFRCNFVQENKKISNTAGVPKKIKFCSCKKKAWTSVAGAAPASLEDAKHNWWLGH